MSKSPQIVAMEAQVREAKTSEEELFDRFFKAKVYKSLYKSNTPCLISKELSLEISSLHQILSNPYKYACKSPSVYLIPRSHDYQFYSGACMYAAVGFSLDLKLWWYVHWSEEIQSKILKYFTIKAKDYSTSEFISINLLLEYAAVILNYATFTHSLSTLHPSPQNPYPILLNWADNISANS